MKVHHHRMSLTSQAHRDRPANAARSSGDDGNGLLCKGHRKRRSSEQVTTPFRCLTIDVPTVTDLYDRDFMQIIIDFVEHAVVPLPQTILLVPGKLFTSNGTGIRCEPFDLS